jgi:hypothetical protein
MQNEFPSSLLIFLFCFVIFFLSSAKRIGLKLNQYRRHLCIHLEIPFFQEVDRGLKENKNERKKIPRKRLKNGIKIDKKKILDCLKRLLEGIRVTGQCTEHDLRNGRGSFRRSKQEMWTAEGDAAIASCAARR